MRKIVLQKEAIALRKSGKTYGEILEQIPVAKSTLSLWLRDVGLSKRQSQQMTEKRRLAQLRGGARRKEMRISESKEIYAKSMKEVGDISKRDIFLIGTALYWAEGAKQKEYRPSVRVLFTNSDPAMVKLFLVWLRQVFSLRDEDISLTIYIHENHKERIKSIEKFWLRETGLSKENLLKPVFKKNIISTKRKNVDENYVGLVRISVRNSVRLNRRIQGWIYGIINAQK